MPEFPPDDKEAIPDHEFLYRRIFPDRHNLVRSDDGIGFRPASGALKSREPLSVDRASLCTPEETRDRDRSSPFHVAEISARVARAEGCRIVPKREEGNPAHALLYGRRADGKGGLSGGQAEKIARRSKIVLLNPAGPLPDAA